MATEPTKPLLLVDESEESSEAMMELIEAGVSFAPVPAEGRGPVLFTSTQTFRGKEGIERYIVGASSAE